MKTFTTGFVFLGFFRLAANVSELGLCSAEEESDLLPSHQWWENSSGRDPYPQRTAVQEEGLSVHLALHIAGAGEGTETTEHQNISEKSVLSTECINASRCY